MLTTLGKAIKIYGKDPLAIEYRTYVDGRNIFAGMCVYKDGKLISLDADNYSLDDKIINWEIAGTYDYNGENLPRMMIWY